MFYYHPHMPVPRPVRAAQWVHTRYRFPGPPAEFVVVLGDADFNIAVDARDWPPEVSGICVRGTLVSSIGINRNDSEGRRRFTLWHEFYHYLVHKDEWSFSCGPSDKHQRERECDIFAAHVLMPEEWVRRYWLHEAGGPAQAGWALLVMARRFQVSAAAMDRRLRELGLSPGDFPKGRRHV